MTADTCTAAHRHGCAGNGLQLWLRMRAVLEAEVAAMHPLGMIHLRAFPSTADVAESPISVLPCGVAPCHGAAPWIRAQIFPHMTCAAYQLVNAPATDCPWSKDWPWIAYESRCEAQPRIPGHVKHHRIPMIRVIITAHVNNWLRAPSPPPPPSGPPECQWGALHLVLLCAASFSHESGLDRVLASHVICLRGHACVLQCLVRRKLWGEFEIPGVVWHWPTAGPLQVSGCWVRMPLRVAPGVRWLLQLMGNCVFTCVICPPSAVLRPIPSVCGVMSELVFSNFCA